MDDKQFSIIVDKLDKMLKLLASENVKGMTREQDKIEALDSLDFRPVEIAKMLGKTPENVSVVLGNLRKKKVATSKTAEQPSTGGTTDPLPVQTQP